MILGYIILPFRETTLAELEIEKAQIAEQKNQLEQERHKFTDAAIRMGLERAHLQVILFNILILKFY